MDGRGHNLVELGAEIAAIQHTSFCKIPIRLMIGSEIKRILARPLQIQPGPCSSHIRQDFYRTWI